MLKTLRISLTFQMVLATILGIFCGLFFGDSLSFFKNWTDIYIMILKITILPYLVAAIIHGVGQLTSIQAKEILKKGLIFIGIAWAINIAMIYLTYFTFPKIKGKGLANYIPEQEATLNFAQLIIPENIFSALSNNIVPAIVIFSLLLGIAFMFIKEKQSTMSFFQTIVDALTTLTSWIAKITPIGTFLIIAYQVGTMDLSTVKQVITYIILYILAICIVVFWIFPRLTSMFTHLSARKWLKDLLPILLLAYTTNVVIVCLPFIMQLIHRETLLLLPKDEKAQSQIQGTVSVLFNLPLGSLFIALFILFSSLFYQVHLTILNQLKLFLTIFLTGLGAVGIGSWINSLTFIVDILRLPQDTVDLFLITIPFTSGFQSMVSAIEIATISLFITFSCRKLIKFKLQKFISRLTVTFAPVLLIFAILFFYNPFPPIQNTTKSIYEIGIASNVKIKMYKTKEEVPPASFQFGEDAFDRILRTKTLRVGYYPFVPPFCFYNEEKGLVGYDMTFAYTLAFDLDCTLELVPLDYATIAEDLNSNLYDIAMSAVTINEERLKYVSFTQPYDEGKYIFVIKGSPRKEYTLLSFLKEDPSIRIAVLKGSSYEMTARVLFPHKSILLLNSYEDFTKEGTPADLLLWTEHQAIPWLGEHPNFSLVVPTIPIGIDSLGYPINEKSGRFLTFLNQWLDLKKSEGFTKEQYNLWVHGKTNLASSEGRRWSILRNVLHYGTKQKE